MDGKPMPTGQVNFNVAGHPPRTLEVKDGAFSGEVYTGKNRIDVYFEKDGPPHPMDPKIIQKVNAIAEKFSGATSTLSADVTASGANDLKFDVTTKK